MCYQHIEEHMAKSIQTKGHEAYWRECVSVSISDEALTRSNMMYSTDKGGSTVLKDRPERNPSGWGKPAGMIDPVPVDYDKIADVYDELWDSDGFRDEEVTALRMISSSIDGNRVLDIGSGSGLLLRLVDVDPKMYLGVDPSSKMTDILHRSFPDHPVSVRGVCINDLSKADMVVSLFGSPSYVDPGVIDEVVNSGVKYFLMFYADEYAPVTYEKTGLRFSRNRMDDYKFDKSLICRSSFKNYALVSNLE